jgi:hypothetical protein
MDHKYIPDPGMPARVKTGVMSWTQGRKIAQDKLKEINNVVKDITGSMGGGKINWSGQEGQGLGNEKNSEIKE